MSTEVSTRFSLGQLLVAFGHPAVKSCLLRYPYKSGLLDDCYAQEYKNVARS